MVQTICPLPGPPAAITQFALLALTCRRCVSGVCVSFNIKRYLLTTTFWSRCENEISNLSEATIILHVYYGRRLFYVRNYDSGIIEEQLRKRQTHEVVNPTYCHQGGPFRVASGYRTKDRIAENRKAEYRRNLIVCQKIVWDKDRTV